jgi:hypothetical protein
MSTSLCYFDTAPYDIAQGVSSILVGPVAAAPKERDIAHGRRLWSITSGEHRRAGRQRLAARASTCRIPTAQQE